MTHWYAIQVRPAAEKKVAEALKEHGIEGYYPVEKVFRHGAQGRKQTHERPLIRGYVFAVLADRDRAMLHDIEGAASLVSFNGRAAAIPHRFIASLIAEERAGGFDHTKPPERKDFTKGQRVKIRGGPYDGRVGVIQRLSGKRRIQVMLDIAKANTTMDDVDLAEEPEPARIAA